MADPSAQTISTQILNYSANPRDVRVGETVTLNLTFRNTGNTSYTFIAGVSLWKPNGQEAPFTKSITLAPGAVGDASWNYTIDQVGDWNLQFAVWKAHPFTWENLLAKTNVLVGYITARSVANQQPRCSLSASPRSGKAPLTVTFSLGANDPDGSISYWVLDVNSDGRADYQGSSTPPSTLNHTYTTPGNYSVALMVSDNNGATASAMEMINVGATNQAPRGSLSANPRSGKAPLTVTFSLTASDPDGSISSWVLDVNSDGRADYQGNGTPPPTLTHTYTTAGNYSIALVVSDNDGAAASATEIVNVGSANQPPRSSLSANPRSGKAPLSVTFSLSASDPDGSISSWVLDVNSDGRADYQGSGTPPSTVSHTYTTAGSYSVALVVSDNNGATASATETVSVGSVNQSPRVSLSASARSGKAPLSVTFSLSASDPDGSVSSWVLDVNGDGRADYQGSDTPPPTISHTYNTPGNYSVALLVSDNDGVTGLANESVNVGSTNQPPRGSLSANPRSGKAPLTVTFSLSASDADGLISSWVLDVNGDGKADYEGSGAPPPTISHTYNTLGNYSVALVVSDNDRVTASAAETINVGSNQPPRGSLSANPRSGKAPLAVMFSLNANDPDGSISSWVLDVNGDGKADCQGNGTPPSTLNHTYATSGNYSVALVVSDNDGATASATETINVGSTNQSPTGSVSASPRSGKAPLTVTFSLSANDPDGSISSWVLDVNGDGRADYQGSSTPPSTLSHTYTASGSYSVALVVTDNDGVTTPATETVTVGSVNQLPRASLYASTRSGKPPITVTFSLNASDPDGSISSWVLDVNSDGRADYQGSGTPPSTLNHTYTTSGNYSVALLVSDNDGTTASATETVAVGSANQPPRSSLSTNPRSGKAPLTVTFSLSASDPDGSIAFWTLDANGDGQTDYSGSGTPPSTLIHTYSSSGNYSVAMVVSDNDAATASATETIAVSASNQPPRGSLSANPRSGKAPLTATFSVSASDSDGSISSWVLDVNGDGKADYQGSGTPPSTLGHTYTTLGNYSATLLVYDNDGATISATETISVGSTNQLPRASLSASPKSGKSPLAVTLSLGASDPDGSISSWVLDVNSDGKSDYQGSGSPPSTLSHTYTTSGNYSVALVVSDNDGVAASATETVNVGSTNQSPTGFLSVSPRSGKAPLSVTFSLSASDSDGSVSSWVLDVTGDGRADYQGNGTPPSSLSHTYSTSGNYSIALVISDNDGATTSATETVTVGVTNQPPRGSLFANPRSGKTPLTVTFSPSASDPDGSISSWVLDVNGDGKADYQGNGTPPSTLNHTYTTSGNYSVALVVTDNDGVSVSATETVIAETIRPAISATPLTLAFTATQGESNPPSQTLTVWNAGNESLVWQVSSDTTWLTLSPSTGRSAGETNRITVAANTSGMEAESIE